MLWLVALGTRRGMVLMVGRRQRSGDEGAKAVGMLERGQ